MKSRLSTLLGLAAGLALAALLLVPEADRAELVAQGFSDLLRVDQTAWAADDLAEAPIFTLLDQSTEGLAAPRLRATVAVDGEPAARPSFRRGLSAALNLVNETRAARALPLFELADDGDLTLALDLTRSGATVTLRAAVSDTAGVLLGEAEDSGWNLPGRSALLPPLLAIFVALLFGRVLLALFCGILVGAILHAAGPTGSLWAAIPAGLRDVFTVYLKGELVETFRVEILGFVIALVAMVGIMSRSGGVQGLISLLLGFARSVRSTLLVTWGMGLLIFFDDYANCLLVGSTMRPLSDRMRISREKLAYIVDSTAAPIAGVSLLSTWIAFEVSTFSAQLPGIGVTDSAYAVFLQTLPYRFYCWFTLAFVLISILVRRDYGPMLTAEKRARSTGLVVREGGTPMVSDEATRIEPKAGVPELWWRAAFPIASVLFVTLWQIFKDGGGLAIVDEQGLGALTDINNVQAILFDGSGGAPIFVGATFGMLLAAFLSGSGVVKLATALGFGVAVAFDTSAGDWLIREGWVSEGWEGYSAFALLFTITASLVGLVGSRIRGTPPPKTVLSWADVSRAGISSMRALFFAVLILLQAWMIGKVCQDVRTADYLVALLGDSLPPELLPVLLFLVSCLVAFSTGSSWSTMSILLPNVVALAFAIGDDSGVGGMVMVVMCIGAVLEGSIFGDHCSPISDTTVLSSVSSACDHMDHVRTQAPYALTTAGIAVAVGYVPSVLVDWWTFPMAFGSGITVIVTVLLLLGRQIPDHAGTDAGAGGAAAAGP